MTALRKNKFGEGGYTFTQHLRRSLDTDAFFGMLTFATALLLIGFGLIGALVYALWEGEYNAALDRRQDLVQLFEQPDSQQTPAQAQARRQRLANSMLELDRMSGESFEPYYYGDGMKRELRDKMQRIATSGEPLQFDDVKRTWGPYWTVWVPLALGIYLTALSLAAFVIYAAENQVDREYLADLPWRRVWPIVFVIFTPLGWPFYIVSAVRVAHAYRLDAALQAEHERAPAARQQPEDEEAAEDDDLGAFPEQGDRHEEERPAEVIFGHSPRAALIAYRTLCLESLQAVLERRLTELRERLEQVNHNLTEVGQRMRELQTQRSQITATVRELETAQRGEVGPEKRQRDIDSEFQRLLNLEGIKKVRVVNGCISLLLEARLDYQEVTYDLGDWELRLTDQGLSTNELRSGTRRTWTGYYPVYRLNSGEFCFGYRSTEIQEHINRGNYLAAIELAVATIQSVNPEHEKNIPRAFKEAIA